MLLLSNLSCMLNIQDFILPSLWHAYAHTFSLAFFLPSHIFDTLVVFLVLWNIRHSCCCSAGLGDMADTYSTLTISLTLEPNKYENYRVRIFDTMCQIMFIWVLQKVVLVLFLN